MINNASNNSSENSSVLCYKYLRNSALAGSTLSAAGSISMFFIDAVPSAFAGIPIGSSIMLLCGAIKCHNNMAESQNNTNEIFNQEDEHELNLLEEDTTVTHHYIQPNPRDML